MPRSPLRLAYFAHSLRSDWNNGNAHFLRGLLDNIRLLGHEVTVWEPEHEWSINNLREEAQGQDSLAQFTDLYPDLDIRLYPADDPTDHAFWHEALDGFNVVLFHEWNPPALAQTLLTLRSEIGYKLLFHDTHHRVSSSPEAIRALGVTNFDGVFTFGDSLTHIYQRVFQLRNVWTLHEAADTRIFRPLPGTDKEQDIVWIGNWGDDERSDEIRDFLLTPASQLAPRRTTIYGVRYPPQGLAALANAGVRYGGYLPNLEAPFEYAASRLTVHIPRQQYNGALTGVPTIRVFEALACGIPLVSAPWQDTEKLFREGDFLFVKNGQEMLATMRDLLDSPKLAASQAQRGLETILARHTCRHRAEQLITTLEEELGI
jgi:spore maturation protein CgeB